MAPVTIYHNPRCSKSRQALAYVQQHVDEKDIQVIEYLKTPLDEKQLRTLLKKIGSSSAPAVSDPTGVDSSRLGAVGISYGPVAGNTDIEDADFVIIADDIDIHMGISLASAGDTNGDGLGELLIGAPLLSPSGAPGAGGAYLVRGSGL